jgi:hypothetical protein
MTDEELQTWKLVPPVLYMGLFVLCRVFFSVKTIWCLVACVHVLVLVHRHAGRKLACWCIAHTSLHLAADNALRHQFPDCPAAQTWFLRPSAIVSEFESINKIHGHNCLNFAFLIKARSFHSAAPCRSCSVRRHKSCVTCRVHNNITLLCMSRYCQGSALDEWVSESRWLSWLLLPLLLSDRDPLAGAVRG